MFDPNKHLVRYAELLPGKAAFVDARIPGSHLKENFCIIGKGVSENPRQPIHIRETDGFHLGAAGQPPGILNSLHCHRTCEIFIIFKGEFRIYWGPEGAHEAVLGPGDIISVPTNCFRGFEVVGDDYGFMFALLGHDDAGGGIEWHPEVLLEGRKHGLFLRKDKTLADTVAGDPEPSAEELYPVMSPQEVAAHDDYSVEEMMKHVSLKRKLAPVPSSLSGGSVEPHTFEQYNVIGDPEDSREWTIRSRDDLALFAFEMDQGGRVPMQSRKEKCVLLNLEGDVKLRFGGSGEGAEVVLTPGDTFDLPKGMPFGLEGLRGRSRTLLVTAGRNPGEPELI